MTLQELIDALEAAKSQPGITPDAMVYRHDSEWDETDIATLCTDNGEVVII